MGYREDMARCRDYIAEHLQEELTPAELAARFGYSFYHFCHVFRSVNGMGSRGISAGSASVCGGKPAAARKQRYGDCDGFRL